MTELGEKLARLEEAIAAACLRAGRSRSEVEMMAVSKTYPAATIIEAASLGLGLFGENRVQEFAGKAPELAQLRQTASESLVSGHDLSRAESPLKSLRAARAMEKLSAPETRTGFVSGHDLSRAEGQTKSNRALAPEASCSVIPPALSLSFHARSNPIRVHLIGHLQTNKAARAAELFDAVDSIDSVRLAEKLNEAAAKLGKRLPVLIEVKLSPEETKAGLEPESPEASELLERLPNLEHIETQGLMTIAPWGVAEEVTRVCFRSLREWRNRWAGAHPRLVFDVLSMGMSGDFGLAIEEGATRIRIGTALFGKRQTWTGVE
jgi:pyridoxal phosphate enzyme (YggS family)